MGFLQAGNSCLFFYDFIFFNIHPAMLIFLIGFMGSGKSDMGKKLAELSKRRRE
jgi:hypothetical protein